jgi:hypothetical protein
MLRFMCGHTKKDWIMNDVVRYWFGVAPANEKLVQCRRRWFCHIQLRPPKDSGILRMWKIQGGVEDEKSSHERRH